MVRRLGVSNMLKLFIILCLSLIAADAEQSPTILSRPKRPADDTVSNFFSELGDLFLDVDRGLAVQTDPKVEHEDNIVAQIFRPSANYFDRIQKNYRNIQHRLGKIVGTSLGQKDAYTERELPTISQPVTEEDILEETITTGVPEEIKTTEFNPFAAADKERELSTKGTSRGYTVRSEECSSVILDDPVLEQVRKEKCARIEAEERASDTLRKLMQDSKQVVDELIPIGTTAVDSLAKIFNGRPDDTKTLNEESEGKNAQESGILSEECRNIILEDPILERLRIERCARIAAEQARRSLQNLIQEPKRVTEVLFPLGSKAVNQFSKGLLGRLGDISNVGETRSMFKEEKVPDEESEEESLIVIDDECLNEITDDPMREQMRRERCARKLAEERAKDDLRKLIEDSRRASELLIPLGTRTVDQFSNTFMKRQGDSAEGDFIPDSLRQFLKDHGEWMLNNPLLARWRQPSGENADSKELTSESPETTTAKVIPNPTTEIPNPQTERVMTVSKSGDSLPGSPEVSNYYKIVNDDGDVIEEERVDVVFKPRSDKDDPEELEEEVEEYEPRDTVILAFTADGVPLKLRMGPEIDNPLRYLHKVLKSAGVSLNVPVESYDDIEPVGKEVLKLGTGILTRAVYIDVSNNQELKSFLRTLMKYKSSGKTQF